MNRKGRFWKRSGEKIFSFCTLLYLAAASPLSAEELVLGRFSVDGLSGWEARIFKGSTAYTLSEEDGRMVVQAVSQASASGLFREQSFDPHIYRYLRWSWKIESTIPGGDERKKSGDDYAARVYVVFSGKFFWQTKAINYIWANSLGRGEFLANAYTSNAMMVAVRSGPESVGQWLAEERDILADYRMLFGADPGQVSAIAIMTDTDDTGGSATAWYGDITVSK